MRNFLKNFVRDESGQDLIEYTMMFGFVVMAAGAIMPDVAASIRNIFESLKRITLASTHTDTLSGDVPAVAIETAKQVSTSSDATAAVVRIVCAVVAVTLLGIIVLRRRNMPD